MLANGRMVGTAPDIGIKRHAELAQLIVVYHTNNQRPYTQSLRSSPGACEGTGGMVSSVRIVCEADTCFDVIRMGHLISYV